MNFLVEKKKELIDFMTANTQLDFIQFLGINVLSEKSESYF